VSPWLLLLASYLLGAVPSSYLAGRLSRGIDLRGHGSGNLGATNTFRVLGLRVAAPVMVFDVFKGWLPTWFFSTWDTAPDPRWALAYGAAAVLGHVYSVFVGFRGGKGVATAGGVFLALAPHAVLTALLVWVVAVAVFRIVSLASLGAAVALVAVLFAVEAPAGVRALGVGMAVFVFVAHRSNIGRLLRGEEYRFGQEHPRQQRAELEASVRDEETR
jgi:acyl phosphate:glycerol-3-phosphate acyltransferase